MAVESSGAKTTAQLCVPWLDQFSLSTAVELAYRCLQVSANEVKLPEMVVNVENSRVMTPQGTGCLAAARSSLKQQHSLR